MHKKRKREEEKDNKKDNKEIISVASKKVEKYTKEIKEKETENAKIWLSDTLWKSSSGFIYTKPLWEYPRETYKKCTFKQNTNEWLCCPLTLAPLKDPILLGDGMTYEREIIEGWMETESGKKAINGPTGVKLITKAYTPYYSIRGALPPRCTLTLDVYSVPVHLLPKSKNWLEVTEGVCYEAESMIQWLKATWCEYARGCLNTPFKYNYNLLSTKNLNDTHILVLNQNIFNYAQNDKDNITKKKMTLKEAMDSIPLLPTRAESLRFIESNLEIPIKIYENLQYLENRSNWEYLGRHIICGVDAQEWLVLTSNTYDLKSRFYVNCRFRNCVFQWKGLFEYYTACQFDHCIFLECSTVGTMVDKKKRQELFFNCDFISCDLIDCENDFDETLLGNCSPNEHWTYKKQLRITNNKKEEDEEEKEKSEEEWKEYHNNLKEQQDEEDEEENYKRRKKRQKEEDEAEAKEEEREEKKEKREKEKEEKERKKEKKKEERKKEKETKKKEKEEKKKEKEERKKEKVQSTKKQKTKT